MKKIFKCCICHQKIEGYKPIRLVKQKCKIGLYENYKHICNYDFCKKHYAVFEKWIRKYNQIESNNNGNREQKEDKEN